MADAANDNAPRISILTAGLMIGLAVLFDLAQFLFSLFFILPVAGWAIAIIIPFFITILAFLIFGIWFKMQRVNYFSGKKSGMKLLSVFGSLIGELIPFLDDLPLISGGVINLVIQTGLEDAEQGKGLPSKAIVKTVATVAKLAAPEAAPLIDKAEKVVEATGTKNASTSIRNAPQPANDNVSGVREAA